MRGAVQQKCFQCEMSHRVRLSAQSTACGSSRGQRLTSRWSIDSIQAMVSGDAAMSKLSSFKRSLSLKSPDAPVAEPVVQGQPVPTPTPQQVEELLAKELEREQQGISRLVNFQRSASLALHPDVIVETEPAHDEEQPMPTPSVEEVEAILGQELERLSAQAQAAKVQSFKRTTSIAVRAVEPTLEPEAEQPLPTPSVSELEAMLERDMLQAAPA